jgi:hypothetical protein
MAAEGMRCRPAGPLDPGLKPLLNCPTRAAPQYSNDEAASLCMLNALERRSSSDDKKCKALEMASARSNHKAANARYETRV